MSIDQSTPWYQRCLANVAGSIVALWTEPFGFTGGLYDPQNLNRIARNKAYILEVLSMKGLLTGLATSLLIICLPIFITTAENDQQKKLIVVPEIVQIGKIAPAQTKEVQLTLQNNGMAELAIKSMTSDCPCTSFRFFDLDGKTPIALPLNIPAGEKLEVKLIFDSSKTKYRGTFTKVILINTDDLEEPIKRVKLAGEIQE